MRERARAGRLLAAGVVGMLALGACQAARDMTVAEGSNPALLNGHR